MENNCSEGGEGKVVNGGNKTKPGLLSTTSQFRAKRTVSFKDQANQPLYTVHHVESLKQYNAGEDKGFSCLKCYIL